MTNTEQKGWREDFVEEGAALEHARWARWQAYLHSRLTYTEVPQKNGNNIAMYCMTADDYERWSRQIDTDYSELTEKEKEKESDRKEVREYLPFIERTLQEETRKAELRGIERGEQLERKANEIIRKEYQEELVKKLSRIQHEIDAEIDSSAINAQWVLDSVLSLIKDAKTNI